MFLPGDCYEGGRSGAPVRGETREYGASRGGLVSIESIAQGTKLQGTCKNLFGNWVLALN